MSLLHIENLTFRGILSDYCLFVLWHFQSSPGYNSAPLFLLPPALQCYCDRCSGNSSCVTDGICYVAIHKSGNRMTIQQRQCVHEYELIPRDRPFICALSAKQDTGVYPICCDTDYCNKEPNFDVFPGKHTHAHTQLW